MAANLAPVVEMSTDGRRVQQVSTALCTCETKGTVKSVHIDVHVYFFDEQRADWTIMCKTFSFISIIFQ